MFSGFLGRWLGVDPLGAGLQREKICNLDCVYCDVGPTKKPVLEVSPCLSVPAILEEMQERLAGLDQAPDFISVTGAGEVTLCGDLDELVGGLKKFGLPVSVLTNSTFIGREKARAALMKADRVILALDAVKDNIYRKICRPPKDHTPPEHMVEEIASFRGEYAGRLGIMTALVKGYNDSPQNLVDLKVALERISPDFLRLFTITRPVAVSSVQPVSEDFLKETAAFFAPLPVQVGNSNFILNDKAEDDRAAKEESVLNFLKLRPATFLDLAESFNINYKELQDILAALLQRKEIALRTLHWGSYYFRP